MPTTAALLIMYFAHAHCHRPTRCYSSNRIKWYNFCDLRRAAWPGKGSLSFPAFPSPERGSDQLHVPFRWEGCSSLHLPCKREKQSRGIWGKTASIHEGLRFLLDLHPTETKCQYCWTYLAPPKAQSYSKQCLSKNSNARLLVYCVFLMPDLNVSV